MAAGHSSARGAVLNNIECCAIGDRAHVSQPLRSIQSFWSMLRFVLSVKNRRPREMILSSVMKPHFVEAIYASVHRSNRVIRRTQLLAHFHLPVAFDGGRRCASPSLLCSS
jgi:hypothetical protein